jgi:hypothetical protein
MNTLAQNSIVTPESVWAALKETDRLQKENERIFKERVAESDRQRKENERILNEKFAETDRLFKELREESKETDRQMKETDRQMKETDRLLSEKFSKTEQLIDKNAHRMKELQELIGSWDNNHGSFAEEYFLKKKKKGKQNFFGEKFNEIDKNLKVRKFKLKDEYDIVLYNGSSVAIVEVKFKAHKNDISKVLNKAETFRILCPDYKDYKIYLGLASMNFYDELEEECVSQGIAVIKQVGENVVINYGNLKVF